jgi:adenylate cyclase
MAVDERTRLALPRIVSLTLIATAAGAIYSYYSTTASGGAALQGIARGIMGGALIGGLCSSFDAFIMRTPAAPLTRAPFLISVAVKSAVYLVVFLFSIAASQFLIPDPRGGRWVHIEREDILFCFGVMFVVSFLFEVNSLLGQNVLLSFATGRYHRPRVEQRIFLMIDMKNSTAVGERLGEVDFHRLLNRFIGDLTGSIVLQGGEIHKYVGDELIATWPLAAGLKDARCVRACFGAVARLAELGPAYEREFGEQAAFRAALHCGPVVVGEMGTVKKEIALIGDTLNTTARIVDACRDSGEAVIVSADLLGRLALPAGIAARALGPVRLRGREAAIELVALEATSLRQAS